MTVPGIDPAAEGSQPQAAPQLPAPSTDRTAGQIDPETLDRVFGTVLPDVTRDELSDGAGARDRDDWYRDNRPPHHG